MGTITQVNRDESSQLFFTVGFCGGASVVWTQVKVDLFLAPLATAARTLHDCNDSWWRKMKDGYFRLRGALEHSNYLKQKHCGPWSCSLVQWCLCEMYCGLRSSQLASTLFDTKTSSWLLELIW